MRRRRRTSYGIEVSPVPWKKIFLKKKNKKLWYRGQSRPGEKCLRRRKRRGRRRTNSGVKQKEKRNVYDGEEKEA